mmetsp:Transcript_52372/g.169945  ORF Transcript_52372/g.169945 Transcript_52372/m.169945 type:complete len:202 (-) Transcript_52372:837-1442(-)
MSTDQIRRRWRHRSVEVPICRAVHLVRANVCTCTRHAPSEHEDRVVERHDEFGQGREASRRRGLRNRQPIDRLTHPGLADIAAGPNITKCDEGAGRRAPLPAQEPEPAVRGCEQRGVEARAEDEGRRGDALREGRFGIQEAPDGPIQRIASIDDHQLPASHDGHRVALPTPRERRQNLNTEGHDEGHRAGLPGDAAVAVPP